MSRPVEDVSQLLESKPASVDSLLGPLASTEWKIPAANVFVYMAARVGRYDVILTTSGDGKLRLAVRQQGMGTSPINLVDVKD
jgi:hypothetical protein